MARDRLLDAITALPFTARVLRLRKVGLESRTQPDVAAALDKWERGDWQERYYCVQSCIGSEDAARLHRMVADPSRTVAGLALKLLAIYGIDDDLVPVLEKLTHRRRIQVLSRLRSRRRLSCVDRFLDNGFASALQRIAELLPFGSAATVQRHFVNAEQCGGLLFWKRMARKHPRIAAQAILDRLSAIDEPDALLLQNGRAVSAIVGCRLPELIAPLARALARFTPLSSLQLDRALPYRANELAEIVLESDGSEFISLVNVAHKLESAIRLRILREQPRALPIQASWFRKLPTSERALIFQEVGRSWRDADGLIPSNMLGLLPSQQQVVEADRTTTLPIMGTRVQTQAVYAAYLTWENMREIVDRLLTHPEGERRGWGWAALLTSLRFHHDKASEVLAMIRKRKFEQDPVRLIIFQSLTALPPGIWTQAHLVEIAGLIREALDAADLSPASVMYLTAYVQKLIPNHPHWAAQQLVVIYAERGNIGGYFLESRINDLQAATLEEAFLDVGKHWGKGNRVGWLVWFASALGKRLRVCTRLLKVLADLLGKESGHHDASIVQLLRRHSPYAEFERLAEALVKGHESWVAVPPIFRFFHQYRQDLLEPSLKKSKFLMRGGTTVELVSLLPPSGYERFTLAQQTALAGTLIAISQLPSGDKLPKDVWTVLRAISFLAILPAIDPSRLIELSNDKRPVVSEFAIRALGRLDAGQGLPTLIAALGDNSARVAIYALRQAMADLPALRVVAELKNAPLKKITVAKEAVRLAGEFGGDAGFEWILELARQELHRDVQIAILRGLWDHLERPETWAILEDAARSADGQILNGVVRIPADRLSVNSRRRLVNLLAGLAAHPDAVVRLAVLNRFSEMPLPDSEGQLMQRALAALTSALPDERTAAAQVIATNSTAKDAAAIAATVGKFREQRLPLHDFVRIVTATAVGDAPMRRRLAPMAGAVIEALHIDPLTAALRLKLAAGILGVERFEQELQTLVAEKFPVSAIADEAATAIEQFSQTTNRMKLEQLEARFAAADDPHLRLLAFIALVVQARDHNQWDEPRRGRLSKYRNDPAPLVAIRAQFFFDADRR